MRQAIITLCVSMPVIIIGSLNCTNFYTFITIYIYIYKGDKRHLKKGYQGTDKYEGAPITVV